MKMPQKTQWPFRNVKKTCKVSCDSEAEDAFILTHHKNGSVIKFECQKSGVRAFAPPAAHMNWKKNQVQDSDTQEINNLTEMVKGNVEGFSAQQIQRAETA